MPYTPEYYQQNKEGYLTSNKKYYQKNKDEIIVKRREKFTCSCGGKYTRSGKSNHEKTQRHINYKSRISTETESESD